jgi:hypothetical protein
VHHDHDHTPDCTDPLCQVRAQWLSDPYKHGRWGAIRRNPERLLIAISDYADKAGFVKTLGDALCYGLGRQIIEECRGSSRDYGDALSSSLNHYYHATAKHGTNGVFLFAVLEKHGFQYDTVRESLKTIKQMMRLLAQDPMVTTGIDEEEPLDPMGAFELVTHDLAKTLGWFCHNMTGPEPPLAPSYFLPLHIKAMQEGTSVGLGSYRDSICIQNHDDPESVVYIDRYQVWSLMQDLYLMDIPRPIIEKLMVDPILVYASMELIKANLASKDFLRALSLKMLFFKTFEELLEAARAAKAGKSSKRVESIDPGLLSTEQRPETTSPFNLTTVFHSKPVDQTPTGRKRHHKNVVRKDEVPPVIDWDEVMERIEVKDLLPSLSETIVRAVLVHGLMRKGNRRADLLTQSLDRKTIWKSSRSAIGDASRRTFDRTLSQLTSKGVLRFRGGVYALGRPGSHQEQASAFTQRVLAIWRSLPH